MRTKTKIGFGAVGILILGYIFAAPYITAYQMKNAAEAQNGEELSEHIDFVTLRQSLKDQMNAMLARKMVQEKKEEDNNVFAALGTFLAGMMVEKIVDVYVTPAGITELMKGEKPNPDASHPFNLHWITELMKGEKPNPEKIDGQSTVQASSKPFSNTSASYESFNKFSVTTRNDKSDTEAKFILRRRGIGWKLTEIILLP